VTAELIESWTFNAEEAAGIVGYSERQFANWTNRYKPFPEKMQGRGYAIYYTLRDLLTLAAMNELVKIGLPPNKAAEAYKPYGSPMSTLLAKHHGLSSYPGTDVFTQGADGRWLQTDGPDRRARVEIRLWPIFDEIFPRAKKAILANPGQRKLAEVRKALADFEDEIEAIRADRWSAK
jgi:hypothetical protein